jgi:hypothetical protein
MGAILIYYFQYRNFFHIFSWRHTLACWTLSLGGGLAGGITAYFLGLDSRYRTMHCVQYSWRHTLACWTLSLGGGLAGGITAYFLGLVSRYTLDYCLPMFTH